MPRLFVALPLPEPIREALLDPMEALPGARWVDADTLHITLRFIGEVDRHQAGDVIAALADVPFRPVALALAGVGHFEHRGRAKSVWARVVPSPAPSPALEDLQHSVELACRRAGMPPETRRFVPHVTLARLGGGSGDPGPWLTRHGTLALGPWVADGFALYESHLAAAGARYEQVARFP